MFSAVANHSSVAKRIWEELADEVRLISCLVVVPSLFLVVLESVVMVSIYALFGGRSAPIPLMALLLLIVMDEAGRSAQRRRHCREK